MADGRSVSRRMLADDHLLGDRAITQLIRQLVGMLDN